MGHQMCGVCNAEPCECGMPQENVVALSANLRQVGGEHYKTASGLQHWDVVEDYGIGYLEGIITGYLCRWKEKAGVQDLKKASHCLEKLIEIASRRGHKQRRPRGEVPTHIIERFVQDYRRSLGRYEAQCCVVMFTWRTVHQLGEALEILQRAIKQAEADGWEDKPKRRPSPASGQANPFGYDPHEEEGR
jgi:hypothetical protein